MCAVLDLVEITQAVAACWSFKPPSHWSEVATLAT
jgi:hypothetical protein